MASAQSFCSLILTSPSRGSFKSGFASPRPYNNSSSSSSSSSSPKLLRSPRNCVVKASGKQLEIVYDPEDRLNTLGDDVDREAPLSRLTLFSPCKINVFLRITGKREDGFHDLASLFHVISLGDTIKFSLSPSKTEDRLSSNVSGVPLDESNLIIKALNLYRKKTGSQKFFWVRIDKDESYIELHGELSPQTSISCFFLSIWADTSGEKGAFRGWARWWKQQCSHCTLGSKSVHGCVVSEKELQQWSSEIGSDIPFFFSHGAAYCTGRGEIVQDLPLPLSLDIPMVLIKPPEACSTAEVYRRFRLDQTSKINPLSLLESIINNGVSQDVCVNDLELPAFEVLPSLKRLKQNALLQLGMGNMMQSLCLGVEAPLLELVPQILPSLCTKTMTTRMSSYPKQTL